jgi:4-deoxy-L-threo-5-hexosulose-uronate ketol-isomerase
MDVRHLPDARACRTMAPEELRRHFLVESLFAPDATPMVYCDADRAIVGSAVPARGPLRLAASRREMAAEYFLERREVGIVNLGGDGAVRADGQEFALGRRDALYVGRGTREVTFASADPARPARFYFVSFPAHAALPAAPAPFAAAAASRIGSAEAASRRTIRKLIHPGGARSCQLVLGLTVLEEGSVWNTMPAHTHARRSEVYLYVDLPEDAVVVHLMGEPGATRHLVVRDGQAALSPAWSLHAGAGTRSYAFVWAMGGENQDFDDMDGVAMRDLG